MLLSCVLCVLFFVVVGRVSLCEARLRSFDDIPPQCVDNSSLLFSTDNFRKAQEELFPGKKTSGQQQVHPVPWAEKFYNMDWGSNLYNISHTPVAYTVIFKVNSENIHNSLAAVDYPNNLNPIDFQTNWIKHVKRYRSKSLLELQKKQKRIFGDKSILKSFAFVREPLDHFVSGMVESRFRGLGFGPHPELLGKTNFTKFSKAIAENQMNMNMTKLIVDSFILGERHSFLKHRLLDWKHFYPQYFALKKWQPLFIGYLDNFNEDWDRMQQSLHINVKYSGEMSHMSQNDTLGFKKLLKRLFAEDVRYLRAMCHLLIRDYVCLGLELPASCSDIYHTYGVDRNVSLKPG